MFLLREVRPSDIDELETLAGLLNTLNLPADRKMLESIIENSRASFGNKVSQEEAEYVFVLRDLDAGKMIGTSMIIARHGTYDRPACYFNVLEEQKYSRTLEKHFHHQLLQLTFHFNGPTEIGGLVLHPDYRGHELKLGKLLSFSRFLYIGMFPDRFRDEIVAELLPPLNEDGTSDLWDWLGRNFTGIDYMTADKLSRQNIEFIRSLFPFSPIYTALLPEHVRDMIGTTGENTKGVQKMLESIGFHYDKSIDPFDGGPTFRVRTHDCELIRRVTRESFDGDLSDDEEVDGLALIGYEYDTHLVRFRATFAGYKRNGERLLLRSGSLRKLRMEPGARFGFLPLTGPDLHPLY